MGICSLSFIQGESYTVSGKLKYSDLVSIWHRLHGELNFAFNWITTVNPCVKIGFTQNILQSPKTYRLINGSNGMNLAASLIENFCWWAIFFGIGKVILGERSYT